ncbi:MAG: choice-of-anchor Q domain-containing protein, partial [Dokdonella sp.]
MYIQIRAIASAALLIAGSAHASVLTWPGTGGCAGTLQACVDASASGDQIAIATNTPIDENLDLGAHSISLLPATTLVATYQPRFAPGRSIQAIAPAGAGDVSVTIQGIRFVDGFISLDYNASGTATYLLRDLQLTQTASAPVYLHVGANGGTATVTAYNNRVSGDPPAYGGSIEFVSRNSTLNGYAAFNRIAHGNGFQKKSGILVDAGVGTANGYVRVFGNDIQLRDASSAGIQFLQQPGASAGTLYARAYSNAVHCPIFSGARAITLQASSGTVEMQILNNTFDQCDDGVYVAEAIPTLSPAFTGLVWNNLIVAGNRGLAFTAPAAVSLANDYNLINAPSNQAMLGAHTITTPALLDAATRPRPGAGSPAIDAADGNTLANGIIDNGLPILDVDGMRRVNGARADIGAYETGNLGFVQAATSANTSGNIVTLDPHGLTNASRLFATRRATAGLPNSYENFGVWRSLAGWTIYHEASATAVVAGKTWNVFVPGSGTFTQTATAANSGPWATQIDNSSTNGLADRILLVRHNYTADGIYDNHPTAVYWDGVGSAGRWYVANADQAALTTGLGYNVYVQPP